MRLTYLPMYGHGQCPHCENDFDLATAIPTFAEAFCGDVLLYVMCSKCHEPFQRAEAAERRCSRESGCIMKSFSKSSVSVAAQSPWLDPSYSNLYQDEFVHAAENSGFPGFEPLPGFKWIQDNNGVDLFFMGLTKLAPLVATPGYKGGVSSWTAPPPSGAGNCIYMVMGRDVAGRVRLVGGNYFSEPQTGKKSPWCSHAFFSLFDSASELQQQHLVNAVITSSICTDNLKMLMDVSRMCEFFYTMPIYLLVIDAPYMHLHAGPAVVRGSKHSDLSYEYFGEII